MCVCVCWGGGGEVRDGGFPMLAGNLSQKMHSGSVKESGLYSQDTMGLLSRMLGP